MVSIGGCHNRGTRRRDSARRGGSRRQDPSEKDLMAMNNYTGKNNRETIDFNRFSIEINGKSKGIN